MSMENDKNLNNENPNNADYKKSENNAPVNPASGSLTASSVLLSVVLSILAGALSTFFTWSGMPYLAVIPQTIVVMCYGVPGALMSAAAYAGGVYMLFFTGIVSDASLTAVMLSCAAYFEVVSLVLAYMLKKSRVSYRLAAVVLAVLIAVSILFIELAPSIAEGKPALYYISLELEGFTMLAGMPPSAAPDAFIIFPYAAALGMLISGIAVGLAKAIYSGLPQNMFYRGKKVPLKPMAPMYLWSLPYDFMKGILVWLVCLLLLFLFEFKYTSFVMIMLIVIAGSLLCVQGFCMMLYMIKYKMGCIMLQGWLVPILLVLFFPSSLYLLALMGIVDQIFRLRRIFPNGFPRKF